MEKLLLDGIEVSVDELFARASFDTVEFSFEDYSPDAIELYDQLLKEVSQRGPGYGAVEYCSAQFTNSIHPYGDVRVTDVDLSSNDDEWCTEVDQAITVTVGIEELCEIMGCDPSGLWIALQDDGDSVLEELVEEDLVETIFGDDEAEWTGVFVISRGANGWSRYPGIASWTSLKRKDLLTKNTVPPNRESHLSIQTNIRRKPFLPENSFIRKN